MSPNIKQFIVEAAIYVVFAVLIIIFVPRYVMERVSVDGSSMNDTLQDRDQLIGEKISVRLDRLKRFDIIYFYPQGDDSVDPYIKRVIGLPGDTVYIEDSTVYINGTPLCEDYAREDKFNAYSASEPIRLNEDEYFVLGDNRNRSADSRIPDVGTVTRQEIIGRAIFRIWPLKSFGKID